MRAPWTRSVLQQAQTFVFKSNKSSCVITFAIRQRGNVCFSTIK